MNKKEKVTTRGIQVKAGTLDIPTQQNKVCVQCTNTFGYFANRQKICRLCGYHTCEECSSEYTVGKTTKKNPQFVI